MTPETTWKDVIADALQQLGGEAHLKQIIEIALAHPKAAGNNNVDAKVRQVVRRYKIFEPIHSGSGHYRLLAPVALPVVNAPMTQQIALDLIQTEVIKPEIIKPTIPTTKEITDTIQGQLLYIGQVYGFHTYAPPADQTKGFFNGKPLADLVTLRDGLEPVTWLKPKQKKEAALIDVLWFETTNDDDLIPRCAFEVEHTTDVLNGINRLCQLPSFLKTQLFIVGPDESKKALYDKHIQSVPFKASAPYFQFRFFDEVGPLFESAAAFQAAQRQNERAKRAFLARAE